LRPDSDNTEILHERFCILLAKMLGNIISHPEAEEFRKLCADNVELGKIYDAIANDGSNLQSEMSSDDEERVRKLWKRIRVELGST